MEQAAAAPSAPEAVVGAVRGGATEAASTVPAHPPKKTLRNGWRGTGIGARGAPGRGGAHPSVHANMQARCAKTRKLLEEFFFV